MENTTDHLKPYLLLICRKKQKIGTGKVRDNRESVCEDERQLVKAHKAGNVSGEKETPVLFEETDGVYDHCLSLL